MTHKEFPATVKRAALARSKHRCEGKDCGAPLTIGKFQFDHVTPDGLNGEPTLQNCMVLCSACHTDKTKHDIKAIARAKRRNDRQNGIRPRPARKIQSPGFATSAKRQPKPSLPPRMLFQDRS